MRIVDKMSEDLYVPRELIDDALKDPWRSCKIIKIKKKNGRGCRTVYHPSVGLKMIQSWLGVVVFSNLPVSSIASAYVKGVSILDNANAHKEFNYMIRVDIKDFFESIKFDDLKSVMCRDKEALGTFSLDEELFDLIRRACFSSSGRLPVGYATSPAIANAVMENWDVGLMKRLNERFDRGFCLTRYADDFVFSTNKKGGCKGFLEEIDTFCKSESCPSLLINVEKTRFMSKMRGAIVTGLVINKDGNVRPGRKYRDIVRLLLSLYKKGSLDKSDYPSLFGHLSYVKYVDPSFFTTLSFKYFEEIENLMKACREERSGH